MNRNVMIKEVMAIRLDKAKLYEPKPNEAIISIHHPYDDPPDLSDNWQNRLNVAFEDLNDKGIKAIREHYPDPEKGEEIIKQAMEIHHAHQIIDWVRSLPSSVEKLVVHCHAGWSRSPAVCMWVAEEFGIEFNDSDYSPNPRVIRLMREASHK